MNIYTSDLRASIIKPCLKALGQYSCDAENLLAGTAIQESSINQLQNAGLTRQGLGIYRITPEKHREIWDHYLIQFPDLASVVRGFASQKHFFCDPHGELISNLNYATVMAWMIYRAEGVEINKAVDVNNLAQLWALNFDNGTGCARNADDFISTYRNSVLNTDCHKMVA